MYVYKQFGVTLPHYSAAQAGYGTAVSKDQLLPGDLVFFSNPISHVGIYVGGGLMINAPRSGDLVTIENVYRSSYQHCAADHLAVHALPGQRLISVTTLGSWGTSTTGTASGGSFGWLNSSGLATVKFNGTYLAMDRQEGSSVRHRRRSPWTVATPVTVDLYSASTKFQQSDLEYGASDRRRAHSHHQVDRRKERLCDSELHRRRCLST